MKRFYHTRLLRYRSRKSSFPLCVLRNKPGNSLALMNNYSMDCYRQGQEIVLISKASPPAAVPAQSPFERIPEALYPGNTTKDVLLTSILLPTLKNDWSYTSTPRFLSWRAHGLFYFYNSVVGAEIAQSVQLLDYGLDNLRIMDRFPTRAKDFLSPKAFRPAWGPPSLIFIVQRELFPRGLSGRSAKLISHLRLLPMSEMRGTISPLPHMHSWRAQRQLYIG